ncbi:MAG: GGDEF domain-containing protein [Ahrensia sp.]|nr:GGDEF domain-containing protein [Ahrensia sp.]
MEIESATLAKKTETYQQAALTDALTGLQNRRYFDDALGQYLEEFKAIGHPLGVIVLDLDHFKYVNDTYGHDVGDEVLRSVTKSLLDYTRYHDVVARIGGEEFAILAPNLDQRALQRLADRIRVAISEITFQAEKVHFQGDSKQGYCALGWNGVRSVFCKACWTKISTWQSLQAATRLWPKLKAF